MLEHCTASGVNQIILVSSGEVFSGIDENTVVTENTQAIPKGSQGFQIKAAEDICYKYSQDSTTKITVVRLPYIYRLKNNETGDGLVSSFIKTYLDGRKKFELPGSAETSCDFISDTEAARLIWLIIDEGISTKSIFVNSGSGKPITFGNVASLLEEHFPDVQISYSGDSSDVPPPMRTKIAKTEYGWNALHSLSDDIVQIKESISSVPVKKFSALSKILKIIKPFIRGYKSFIILEYAAATALLHFLTSIFKSFSFSNWIDFRLIFVVILSSLHGTVGGIGAGVIAGVMLFLSLRETDWRLILYNTENWIPFALYLIIGVALGSKSDRHTDNLTAVEDRLELSERTNVYLVELYDEAFRIKDKYRDQILSYRDNFGRIYSIVKKLNGEMSEYVFSSAIEVVEDVLQNNSVAIYSVSADGAYARMAVCSKAIFGKTRRSMRLKDYPQISEKLYHHDTWFNRDLMSDLPAYCSPVYNEDKLIALVMLWHVEVDQMTLHYSNLYRIICGLIQESLVRAVKFNKLKESSSYFPDTRILMKEAFSETFSANLSLTEQEKAEFGLIVADKTKEDLIEQNVNLEACIRESDTAGVINNKQFGIILKNVAGDDIQTLLDRFKAHKIKAKLVSVTEMKDYMSGEKG